ncbi:hypothetical protein [Lutibacter sp.]
MKKITFFVFFALTIVGYSQKKMTPKIDNNSPTKSYATLRFSSGISTPSSNFSDNAYAKNGNYFELSGAYYFSKFGIGISVGQIASPTNENFSNSINSTDLSTTNTTQNWKQFYYGIGPEYKALFGNFNATFSTKIGLQSVKSINLESNYTNGETPIAILKIKSDKTSSLSYFSTDLRFGYNLSSNFSLYATVNYMSALSNGITISKSKITDSNQNGIIDAEDLKFATGSATIDYETSTQNIKPQSTNFGIGISYIFRSKKGYHYSHRLTRSRALGDPLPGMDIPLKDKVDSQGRAPGDPIPGIDITVEQGDPSGKSKRKRPGRTTYSNITLERSQAKGDGDDENNGTKAINHDASRNNNTNSIAAPDSKGNGNGKVLQGYTKESTMIFVRVDETSLRKSNTKIPKDKFTQENDKRMSKRSLRNRKRLGDKRYREKTKARTLRSADKRYRERTKARTLRSADKRYRERVKPRTLRSADKRYRERTKARTLRSADKRYRERTKPRSLRSADKRYRERVKPRTLRSTDKRYRERTKARTLRSADKRYRERTKARTLRSADKRYRKKIRRYRMKNNKNTIQNDKPVKITTEGNNKVNPSTNLDARFLKAQNYQTIHIAKSKFQLTAPLIISKDQTELINYNWTIKNNKQNRVETFTGKTINYNFDVSGTYEIEIIPVVNNKNLNSYHLNIICN